jgi:dTDP-glucose 4,6-dehydratase
MPTKVLLTGGCGFIGSHVVNHLLVNTDWEIIIIDSLSYAGDVGRLTNIECYDKDRIKIFWHDLRSPIMESLAERIGQVDYIINMASESDVERSLRYPREVILNNVNLAINMLEYARVVKPKKFIQISTDEVFGPAYTLSHTEWEPHKPSNPYAASKSAQEQIAFAYWRSYGVPIILTSTMNNFGERQHPEKFVPKCIKYLLEGKTMPLHARKLVYGGVVTTWEPSSRVWLHARNHADALLWLLNHINVKLYSTTDFSIAPGKFNIAGERELNNEEILFKIAGILKVKPLYEYVDYHSSRPGHDHRYALDGSKIRDCGWTAPVGLDESFERTVLWSKEHPEWLFGK